MAGQFVIGETNYNGYLDPDSSLERFKPWVRFLNSQSLVSTTITTHAELLIRPLQDFYSTAINTTLLDKYRISGDITGHRSITITTDDVNRILGFPRNNFAEILTDDEIV